MAADPLVVSVPDPEYAEALADLEGVDAVVWDMEQPHPRGSEIRLAVVPYMTQLSLADVTPGSTRSRSSSCRAPATSSSSPSCPTA